MTQTRLKKQRLQKYVGNRFGEKTNQDGKKGKSGEICSRGIRTHKKWSQNSEIRK